MGSGIEIGAQGQLWVMAAAAYIGAMISADREVEEIHRQNTLPEGRELPHPVLAFIRFACAAFVAYLLVGREWRMLTLIAYAGLLFATPHRLLLFWWRTTRYPKESRGLTWWHLRERGYDTILNVLPTEKMRFVGICALEYLAAFAIYYQASKT